MAVPRPATKQGKCSRWPATESAAIHPQRASFLLTTAASVEAPAVPTGTAATSPTVMAAAAEPCAATGAEHTGDSVNTTFCGIRDADGASGEDAHCAGVCTPRTRYSECGSTSSEAFQLWKRKPVSTGFCESKPETASAEVGGSTSAAMECVPVSAAAPSTELHTRAFPGGDRPVVNIRDTGRVGRGSLRQGCTYRVEKGSPASAPTGDNGKSRAADDQPAEGAATSSGSLVEAALRRIGSYNEQQGGPGGRPGEVCHRRQVMNALWNYSEVEEALSSYEREDDGSVPRCKNEREADPGKPSVERESWTISPVETTGEPLSQLHVEPHAEQGELLTAVKDKPSASVPGDVQVSKVEMKPCTTMGSDCFSHTMHQQQAERLQDAGNGEVMLPSYPFSCGGARPLPCPVKINRPLLDSEDLMPYPATPVSASGISGPDREWGFKSCSPGERGKTSAAAVAAAAAASFEKQAGALSCRTSRLTRDFTDIVVVGKGGCGRVLKARHLLDGRVYAIKEIKFAASSRHLQSRMQLFLREVQCLRRLDSNENIVRYFSSWVEVNPLSKTSSSPQEEDASAAAPSGMYEKGIVSTHAAEDAATPADALRQNQEDGCKSKLAHSAYGSCPLRGKAKSEECLSFYSVSHSQTSRHSERPDDCGTAHTIAQTACTQVESSEENVLAGCGTLVKSADDETLGTVSLTSVHGNDGGKEVIPPVRSSRTDARSDRCCAAAASSEEATITAGTLITVSPPKLLPDDDARASCANRVNERAWCSVRGQNSREFDYQRTTRGGPDAPATRFYSVDCGEEVRGVRHRTALSACDLLRANAARQRSSSPTSRGPGTSYSERGVAYGRQSAQQADAPEVHLSRGRRLEYDASPLLLPASVGELGHRNILVLKAGDGTCRGDVHDAENVSLPYAGHEIQSYSNAEAPDQMHAETRGSEHAYGVAVSLSEVQPKDTAAASPNKTKLLSPDSRCEENPLKRHECTNGGNVSSILRLALQRGRTSRSKSDQGSPGMSCGVAPRAHDEYECNPGRASHSFSPVSSPGSLRSSWFHFEPRSKLHCAKKLTSGCTLTAFCTHDGQPAGERHCPTQNSARNTIVDGSKCLNKERIQISDCSDTEERSATDVPSTAGRQKRSATLRHTPDTLVGDPNTSAWTRSTPHAADEKPAHPDTSHDSRCVAGVESVHADDKAAFQSAISVEDTKECDTLEHEEEEPVEGQFVPVPRTDQRMRGQPIPSEEGMTEANKSAVVSENGQGSCCQAESGASDLVGKESETAHGGDAPAFVALDDFWCCDNFGPEIQPDGLEIVFAEEALPCAHQKHLVQRPEATEEGVIRHSDETLVAANDADTSVLVHVRIPAPVTCDEGYAGVCVPTLACGEQHAPGQQTDTPPSTEDLVVETGCPAVSQRETEQQRYLSAVTRVSALADSHPVPLSDRCSTGNRTNDENAFTCTEDASAADEAEISMWSSPVSPVTAAPATAEDTAHELLMSKTWGKVSPDGNPRDDRNANTNHHAAPAVGHLPEAREAESANGQREQSEGQQRRHEQQQTDEPRTQQQEEQEPQQHMPDAWRTAGFAKLKQGGGTRVEVSLYIQMEYCPVSLDEYIARTPEIDPERNEEIMSMIVNGLYSCHSAGIMHRDLKPSNIFIKEGGTVKLGDFGLAFSEDMDDDFWTSSPSASSGATRCPRDVPGSSRLRAVSALLKGSKRASSVSPAVTPRTPSKTTAGHNTYVQRGEGRQEVQSPYAASFGSGTGLQELYSPLSWPLEPPHNGGKHITEEHTVRKAVTSQRLHPAGDFRVAELGRRDSAFQASHKNDSTVHNKSTVSTPCGHLPSPTSDVCAHYAVNSIRLPTCQREDENEDAAARSVPRGHSLPAPRSTGRAGQLVRVYSEGQVRQKACASYSSPRRDLGAEVHSSAHLHQNDIEILDGQHCSCWRAGVQSRPASARSLLQQHRFCPRCCPSSTRTPRHGFLNSVLALSSCGCPLDTPALTLGETRAAQTDEDAKVKQRDESGQGRQASESVPDTATRHRIGSKDSTKQDLTSVQEQQRTVQQSDEDRCGNHELLGSDPCTAGSTVPSSACDMMNSASAHEPQASHNDRVDNLPSAVPMFAAPARPVVVVQPPPAASQEPAGATKQDTCVPLSPHCLLPVRGTQGSASGSTQRAEDVDRSRASGGNAHSPELNSGSARTLASHPGSYLSPALSALASPAFSNRTTGVGTSAYAPPEQLKGGQYDYSVDIWSLGLIAIDLFTRCETAMERATNFRNAREGRLPLSLRMHYPWVVPFCQWCLQKDPLQRPTIKQLYTHQCLTGSVFTPRSPLISPVPVTRILAPAVSLSSPNVQATAPDVPVNGSDRRTAATAEQVQTCSAMSRDEQGGGFHFLPHTQQRAGDSCGPGAGTSTQCQQWDAYYRGRYGSVVHRTTEDKAYLKPLTDDQLGSKSACTEGLHLSVTSETKDRMQQRGSERASESGFAGARKGIRKGNTSPSLPTTPLQPPAEFKKSASALFSGDEAESPQTGDRRTLLHAPVPLSALTLPEGVAFRGSSPIRCSSPVCPDKQPFPAYTGQLAASASFGQAHCYNRSSKHEQSGEVIKNERISRLCNEQHKHLPLLRRQAENKERGPHNTSINAGLLPTGSIGNDTHPGRNHVAESTVSVTKISSHPVSGTTSRQSSTLENGAVTGDTTRSRTTHVTADTTNLCTTAVVCGKKDEREKLPCRSNIFREDAAIGETDAWKKPTWQEHRTARNNKQTTEGIGCSSVSSDAFGGTGSTLDEQYASLYSDEEPCEPRFDTCRKWESFTRMWPGQAADTAVLFSVGASGDASADKSCWQTDVLGRPRAAERVNPRTAALNTGIPSTAVVPTKSPADLVARTKGQTHQGSASPCGASCKDTVVTILESKEPGRQAERDSGAHVKNSNDVTQGSGLTIKEASGKNNTEASCFTRKKSLDDCIHSAVKNYAQEVLDRCCDASAADSSCRRGRRGSAAVRPVPWSEDHASSSGVWRKSDLFELRMPCATDKAVRPPGDAKRVCGGDQPQMTLQQATQRLGGQHDGTGQECSKKKCDSYEESASSMPSPRGSMHLRGFLTVSSRSIEQRRAQRSPLCRRVHIYMRSRRGEWKSRFAAVDTDRKLMYIFSDRNDATKAKRVIQIEGEDGYSGLLMWEENGSWAACQEQNNAHIRANRYIHDARSTAINATAAAERRLAEPDAQVCSIPCPTPSAPEEHSSGESCASNSTDTTCSGLNTSLKHAAGDDAKNLNVPILREEPARLASEAARTPASSFLRSYDSTCTHVSLRSHSKQAVVALQVEAGTLGCCPISEQEHVGGGDTGSCMPRSRSRTELPACAKNPASANGTRIETGTDKRQVRGYLGDGVAEKPGKNGSEERATSTRQSIEPSTQLRLSSGDEFCSCTKEGGNDVQQGLEAEAEHVGGLSRDRTSFLEEERKIPPHHHKQETSEDNRCRGVILATGALEGRGIAATGRYRSRLLDRVKELCVSSSLKLHSGEGKADGTAVMKKQPPTEKRADFSTVKTRSSKQRSTSQKNGRWNSWLAKNERTFGGWLVRSGLFMRKAEPEESGSSRVDPAQGASQVTKDDMQIASGLPKSSQFRHLVSDIGVRSVCELNILLTHNSLLDDIWMRVVVGASRSLCSASHAEEGAVGTSGATNTNPQHVSDTARMHGREGQHSAEDEDEAVSFVESLMTCFQFTELVGEDTNNEATLRLKT